MVQANCRACSSHRFGGRLLPEPIGYLPLALSKIAQVSRQNGWRHAAQTNDIWAILHSIRPWRDRVGPTLRAALIWGIIDLIGRAALCGRRVEVDIKSRDLAVPCDDEIHTGVLGRFAFRPRAPRQPSRIVQNLGRAMRRINIVRMRRSEIAGKLVQCVVTDESAGRHAQHTIFGVEFLNCGPSASRITFTENFRKIAVEQRLDTTASR